MDNKKKIGIIVAIVILVIIIIACAFIFGKKNSPATVIDNTENRIEEQRNESFVKEELDGKKINISNKIKNATFDIDGLTIKNIELSELAGKTDIKADVVNNSNSDKGDIDLRITLLDNSGKMIVDIGGYIGNVKAGATAKLRASTTLDYSNAYDIKIEKR